MAKILSSMDDVIRSVTKTWPVEKSCLFTHEAAAALMSLAEDYPDIRSAIIRIVTDQLHDRLQDPHAKPCRNGAADIRGAAVGHKWRQRTVKAVLEKYRSKGRPSIGEIAADLRVAFERIAKQENSPGEMMSDSTFFNWARRLDELA